MVSIGAEKLTSPRVGDGPLGDLAPHFQSPSRLGWVSFQASRELGVLGKMPQNSGRVDHIGYA